MATYITPDLCDAYPNVRVLTPMFKTLVVVRRLVVKW
jgi:hypothetical protein